jgi:nicotinate-nucleotide adenylyltransferase
MRIAILGGSFDPIHNGHIQMANQAIEKLGVDEVWFMPTSSTPLKEHTLTLNQSRIAMIDLVVKKNPSFKLCTLELERQGKSYTYDTLKVLKEMYPNDTFYWIIGNDQLAQFDKWKHADELVEMAHFVCFDRDGQLTETKYDIKRLHMPMVPVSSSEIRIGNKLNYLPEDVLEYIYKNRLYVEDFVSSRLKKKRFEHSVSVANLCEEFALSNGLDCHLAYLIGLFHDIAKYLPEEEMRKWMEKGCPENLEYAFPVWHGFVGAEICRCVFGLKDKNLYEAIYHHVLGTSQNPYAMIVFCADKLDPLRGYDSSAMIQACKEDIVSGFKWVTQENKKYLERG